MSPETQDTLERPDDKLDPAEGAAPERQEREPAADTPAIDDGTEARARSMGWRPQEEFRGDPSAWKDAKTFVEAADNSIPIMRERLDTSLRRQRELETTLNQRQSEYADNFKRLERMSAVALDRQRAAIVASYEGAKRQAVETGDTARYDALDTQQRAAVKDFDTLADAAFRQPEQQQQRQAPAMPPEQQSAVQSWQASNAWYGKDEAMTMLAEYESRRIAIEHPGLTVQQNLAEVTRAVARRFPEKFSVQPQSRPGNGVATVESGSRMPANAGGRKGWSDLPSDARSIGTKQIRDGLFKDEADYAKEYWSQ